MITNSRLTKQERQWIMQMFAHDIPNRNNYISQMNCSEIYREETNYYLSIYFRPQIVLKPVSQSILTGVPVEMRVFQENVPPIQFLLHVKSGIVSELEIFNADGSPLVLDINWAKCDIDTILDERWKPE